MIIWINGPFGVGKTTIANELHNCIPNSIIYNPENLGTFIRNQFPKGLHIYDYQDYEFWRKGNFDLLLYLYNNFNGHIIVPMSLYKKRYFDEIIGELKRQNVIIKCFSLIASKNTIKNRLSERLEIDKSWAINHMDEILKELKCKEYGEIIDAEELSIEEAVNIIATKCNIPLL